MSSLTKKINLKRRNKSRNLSINLVFVTLEWWAAFNMLWGDLWCASCQSVHCVWLASVIRGLIDHILWVLDLIPASSAESESNCYSAACMRIWFTMKGLILTRCIPSLYVLIVNLLCRWMHQTILLIVQDTLRLNIGMLACQESTLPLALNQFKAFWNSVPIVWL